MRASVTLSQPGVNRHLSTDLRGLLTLNDLAPGDYRLTVAASGFDTQTSSLVVAAGQSTQRTVTLALHPQATRVEVISATPLPDADVSIHDLPRPAQAADSLDLTNTGSINLPDLLNKRLTSVYSTEMQGNPFQPDINYRGYTASPLLGTPQGLSVFVDGVRMNQPFGDVVSWDLIPKIAIQEVALVPGSDPLFGLNTLGGAISVRTKDGESNSGTNVELSGGSFGRKAAEAEHGGFLNSHLSYYAAANLFFEDGWRAASPSDVRQFFGKLTEHGNATTLSLTASYVNNALVGNGLQDERLLLNDYRSVYTKPDSTANRSPFVNLNGRHRFSPSVAASGNVYYRYISTRTLNGDLNGDSLDQSVYQLSDADVGALTAAGYSGFPVSGADAANTPFPKWRCIAQALQGDSPDQTCSGVLNSTASRQHEGGLLGQIAWNTAPHSHRNQLIVGGGYTRNHVGFRQGSELGYLNADRSVTGVGAFGDGVSGGSVDGQPYDTRVDLRSIAQTGSFFVADTLHLLHNLSITASGRYNRAGIHNLDRLNPPAGSGSLTSDNAFGRLNPSLGFTYSPFHFLSAYASYSQSSRTPTAIELGCADAAQPCRLPNALASDPPLRQVVTNTWEAGLRSGGESAFGWSAGWFRADNRDDLLFVSSPQTGFGYFRNFGRTRRQGAEVSVNSRVRRLTIGGGYTFLNATFESPETLNGSANSSNLLAQSGEPGGTSTIAIQPGNQIPLTPRHLLKSYADIQVTSRLSLDLNEVVVSKSYARGNENNLNEPAPPYYLGNGISPGYALLNAGVRLRLTRWMEAFGQANNLLDHRYYTAAQLGTTGFTASGSFIARPFAPQNGNYPLQYAGFYAPGAPRGVWGGIRLHF